MEAENWSVGDVQALLSIWSDSSIQRQLDSSRIEKVFKKILHTLTEMGVHRSIKQCREKIKKTQTRIYKKIKDHNTKVYQTAIFKAMMTPSIVDQHGHTLLAS
jgi:hemerythrin superfamily protein